MAERAIVDVPGGIDIHVPALGIRQPWMELILRGVKTLEVRRATTHTRGLIYLYSSKVNAVSENIPGIIKQHAIDLTQLPHGQLVGCVEIVDCRPAVKRDARAACTSAEMLLGYNVWELKSPVRFEQPLDINYLPYGTWFYPYKRVGNKS